MATVRGIPNPPAAPQYVEEPAGFRNRAARAEAQAQNVKLHKEYATASMYEGQARDTYKKALNNPDLIGVKGAVPELAAAAQVRGKQTSGKAHDAYKDPMEYIADLWADGFISDKKAQGLLSRLQQDGGIVANAQEKTMLDGIAAREHVAETRALEKSQIAPSRRGSLVIETTPAQHPEGTATKLEKKYVKDGVISEDNVTLPEDSPIGFLADELKKGHITAAEQKMMLAWERKPERAQTTEELAALKQQVMQQLLGSRPDMDKGQAALMAMGVVQELRDPFAHEMNKLLADIAPQRTEPASVDIGELKPVTQGGFGDRELQRRATPAKENKSPER